MGIALMDWGQVRRIRNLRLSEGGWCGIDRHHVIRESTAFFHGEEGDAWAAVPQLPFLSCHLARRWSSKSCFFMVKSKCPKVDILSHVRPAKIPVHNLLFSKELFDNKPVPTGLLSLGQGGIKKTSTLGQGVPLIGPHGRSNIFPWPVQPIPLVQREFYLGGRD